MVLLDEGGEHLIEEVPRHQVPPAVLAVNEAGQVLVLRRELRWSPGGPQYMVATTAYVWHDGVSVEVPARPGLAHLGGGHER